MNHQHYTPFELVSKLEYALLALLELASHPNSRNPLTVAEITAKHGIPDRYLEQILTILRRGGVVHSHRGSRGGYVLAREAWQISVLDVLALLDGERKPKEASRTMTIEREVVYSLWQQANLSSQQLLADCTIQDLCHRRDAMKTKTPMYYI